MALLINYGPCKQPLLAAFHYSASASFYQKLPNLRLELQWQWKNIKNWRNRYAILTSIFTKSLLRWSLVEILKCWSGWFWSGQLLRRLSAAVFKSLSLSMIWTSLLGGNSLFELQQTETNYWEPVREAWSTNKLSWRNRNNEDVVLWWSMSFW